MFYHILHRGVQWDVKQEMEKYRCELYLQVTVLFSGVLCFQWLLGMQGGSIHNRDDVKKRKPVTRASNAGF